MLFHVNIGLTNNMKPILLWLSVEPQSLYPTHYRKVNSQDMLTNTESCLSDVRDCHTTHIVTSPSKCL